MATFCKLDDNNKVIDIIKVSNLDCGDENFPESEIIGQQFLNECGIEGRWIQTSFNSNFRGVYGGIGFTYDEQNDAFIPAPVRLEDGSYIIPTPPHKGNLK